jgi:hypothetical protein
LISESCLRFFCGLSLLLLVVIDGLILTLSIKRGLFDSCVSPLIEGEGGGIGDGRIDDAILVSVCDVLSKPCQERRSFFAR